MKKLFAILLMITICASFLLACKKEEETVNELPQEEAPVEEQVHYTFGYCCTSMNNPYFIALEGVMREALEAEGHTLITMDAEVDADIQKEQIQKLIEQKVDAVFLTPVDWVAIKDSLQLLKDAGIPIINVDTSVQDVDLVDAYVGSDNTRAGELCGEYLLSRLPQGGKILIVECPNRNSIIDRMNGFERTIAKKGFEVVARIDGQAQLELALTQVEEALKQYPDIVAIMCGNDQMAQGALVAANTVAAEHIQIYSVDGSPDVKEEIAKENAKIVATVAQSTEKMGKEAVRLAFCILNGESFEKNTFIDTILITKENVAEYGIDSWQ
ncbi:MAG: sugar ABC transporter substrate-binding protein [Faecalimonas sp.]|nr:sugar ABC transporter substrate-binding protein [Faecalimonas sp.]